MTAIAITTEGSVIAEPESEFKIKPRPVEVLVPLADRLVVRPDSAEEMIGSFYIPDVAQERPARGVVLAVGPDVAAIAPGNLVLYGHFTGAEAKHGDDLVLVLREADVFARVETLPG